MDCSDELSSPSIPSDKHIWYALAPAVSLGILSAGALYWSVWAKLLPRLGKYELVPKPEVLQDGTEVTTFEKTPV